MQLASPFASISPVLRRDCPLSDDQIRTVAPSIFADAPPHESRSQRYAYIPTATVLTQLRKEGFQPFMVTQTRVRDEGKREHTKHMVRLRHIGQINADEANEIILLNSHDGTSSCGSTRRRHNRHQHRPQRIRPGIGGFANPEMTAATPSVKGKSEENRPPRRRLRQCSGGGVEDIAVLRNAFRYRFERHRFCRQSNLRKDK